MEAVAHAGENVLGKFRDHVLEVTPEAVSLILKCIDKIRDLLGELEESGTEPEGEDRGLIAELNAMADGGGAAAAPAPVVEALAAASAAPAQSDEGFPVAKELEDEYAQAIGGGDGPVQSDEGFPVAKELLDEVEEAHASGAKAATQEELDAELAGESDEEEDSAPAPASEPVVKAEVPATAAKPPAKKEEAAKAQKESSVAASSIRVNVDVLEDLMNLVSEMVLTRNQLLQMVRGKDESEFAGPLQRLNLITSDLQEGVMKTRMQPIGNAWAKLPRIVRDLAVESGKKIDPCLSA